MFYTIELKNKETINLLQDNCLLGYKANKQLKSFGLEDDMPAFFTLIVKNESLENDWVHDFFDIDWYRENSKEGVWFKGSTYENKIENEIFLSHLLEVSKDVEETAFILTYNATDSIPDQNLSTNKLLDIISEFIKDCQKRKSGNQLILLTDRFELMDYYSSPKTVWLYDESSIYSLDEFLELEKFEGRLAMAYRDGRFGGI